jgi:hypothetical protein
LHPAAPSGPEIRIAIDEIVVDGVAVADPGAFRADLVAELTALASGYAADRATGAAPAHPGGTAAVLSGAPVAAGSATLGADVARSVWASMIPASRSRS